VTQRILWLLHKGVPPQNILALTFSNKAAQEMRSRILADLQDQEIQGLHVSTFHSLGARFLRQHASEFGRSPRFLIYDEREQLRLIHQLLKLQGREQARTEARSIQGAIEEARNRGLSADQAISALTDLDMKALGRRYELQLQLANAFDFGDLIRCPALLMARDPQLSIAYQRRWPWVLVDEFQDTNEAQHSWLSLLAPPGSNLTVVGDEDQAIYGWRGARMEHILEFDQSWPSALILRLEQNYRSSPQILKVANALIHHNQMRLGKRLWTQRAPGPEPVIYRAEDGRAEARWIASSIRKLSEEEGRSLSEIAILLRSNSLSLPLEEALPLFGLPYQLLRGRSFYERAEIRDALAYLRLLLNPQDDLAFTRVINTPRRGVGAKSLERLQEGAQARNHSLMAEAQLSLLQIKGRARKGIQHFLTLFEEIGALKGCGLRARCQQLLKEAGLLKEEIPEGPKAEEERQRQDSLFQLLLSLSRYEEETKAPELSGFLENLSLMGDQDGDTEEEVEAVQIVTVHGAKGLEFPVVFLLGLEEDLFPHRWSQGEEGLEEERRLCYVALTRAQEQLFLSYAYRRRLFGDHQKAGPSRFLFELSERPWGLSTPQPPARIGQGFPSGTKVYHSYFGRGEVLAQSSSGAVTVQFQGRPPLNLAPRFLQQE